MACFARLLSLEKGMKIIQILVGKPQVQAWKGREVLTSIFKHPAEGPLALDFLNLEGDAQADLRYHGGADKAVYAYPAEHYPFWCEKLSRPMLEWGSFGENLVLEGLLEAEVQVGDVFEIGTAHLQAIQPRQPCYKLGLRLNEPKAVKYFHEAQRPGIYFRVLKPGVLQAGDSLTKIATIEYPLGLLELNRWLTIEPHDAALMDKIRQCPILPQNLREYLESLS